MKAKPALFCCLTTLLMLPAMHAQPQEADEAPPLDAVGQAILQVNEEDNAVTINRDEAYVDVSARVCLREAEFLEMLVCTPDTREHESILVTDASPSTIHLALLLLGLEPGSPLSYDRDFNPPRLIEATGPRVSVFVVINVQGVELEVPANSWVRDNQTEEMMQGNAWVFAGSQITEVQGERVYYADVNGSVISLVNFGDDLLTLENKLTQENDSHNQVWAPLTEAIPEVGTAVAIRLRPDPRDVQADDAPEAAQPELPEG